MDDYNRILLSAREQSGRLRDEVLRQVVNLYVRLVAQMRVTGEYNAQTARQLAEISRSMLQQYGSDYIRLLSSAVRESAGYAANGHSEAVKLAFQRAGVTGSVSFAEVPTFALQHMANRRLIAEQFGLNGFSGFFKTVLEAHLKEMAGQIDTLLMDSVTLGDSASTVTKKLAKMLAQNEPEVLKALEQLGPRGGFIRGAVEDKSLPVDAARSLLKRSKLIAVHEINTAYSESDIIASIKSPVVLANKWRLSGNHPERDVCDILAEADVYGMGDGVYPSNFTPGLAHPRCRCWNEKVLRHPALWSQSKPPLPTSYRRIRNGGAIIGEGVSDKYIENQEGLANRLVRAAFEAESQSRVAA